MSVYNKAGSAITTVYGKSGSSLSQCYDKNGNELLDNGDYNQYSNEYQHTILTARDAWKTAYRADNTVVPLVLTTDQHSFLSDATHKINGVATGQTGRTLYAYLGLAIKWSEVSASLNLGDVCADSYSESAMTNMQSVLSPVPMAKQINVAGNHDEKGLSDNDEALDDMFDTYFNNENYNGNVRFQHRGFETMIDTAHSIRYVCIGSWDFVGEKIWSQFNISTASINWLISTLSTVDNYDIIVLSHIQPSKGDLNVIYPAVDGKQYRVVAKTVSKTGSVGYDTPINDILAARKSKTSGTLTDSSGVLHSFDFSNCTSDLICTLSGHSHEDWYNYLSGVPSIVFDAYRYDYMPFYLVNVDRTNSRVDAWKIDETPAIQTYSVPFEQHINPCTGVALQASATVEIGETVTLIPTLTVEYEDDGTYPVWVPVWRSYSTSVATVNDGVVEGVAAGTCRIRATVGNVYAECVVTVTATVVENE